MLSFFRQATAVFIASGIALATTRARADDAGGGNPCGNFDFAGGVSCKIEVSGGCTANCTPLKFEAACSGRCNVSADTQCTNNCSTQCVAACDPAHLDCFVGCHGECDQPTTDACKANHPNADCVTDAKAECDVHCKDACRVTPTPNTCQAHCDECCHGSCTTQINADCDLNCFADVQGGCTSQCQAPEGGIFCNDQYVHASDVQACIQYLAAQKIQVDVSARGSAQCDLTGCHSTGAVSGCAASGGSSNAVSSAALGLLFAGVAGAGRSRRRRKN